MDGLSAAGRIMFYSAAFFVFIVAIITDFLDGFVARKLNIVTDLGKHLDPQADSLFFIIVFCTFFAEGLMSWYFLAIVVFREGFMHLFLRPFYKKNGKSLPANIFGKTKTFCQCIFSLVILAMIILIECAVFGPFAYFAKIEAILPVSSYVLFALIAALSLFSLGTYLVKMKSDFKKP